MKSLSQHSQKSFDCALKKLFFFELVQLVTLRSLEELVSVLEMIVQILNFVMMVVATAMPKVFQNFC